MWRCFNFFALVLCFQTLRACECGRPKRSAMVDRSYLSPLAQSNYDGRSNQFLAPKLPYTLPMATNKALTMNYNLASKALQNQRSSSSYTLTETTPNSAVVKPAVDPSSKLSDLLSLRLTLKAQKDAITTMEDQLALQISEALRQFGSGGDDPTRRPTNTEQYAAPAALNYQAPAAPPLSAYPSPINYGALGASELYQLGARKEMEGQEAAAAAAAATVKPLVAQQMAAYSPYSGYSAANSAGSQSYTGATSSANCGYQTALT